MLAGKCEKHPDYQAIHEPKCNCLDCWKIYAWTLKSKNKLLQGIIDCDKATEQLKRNLKNGSVLHGKNRRWTETAEEGPSKPRQKRRYRSKKKTAVSGSR